MARLEAGGGAFAVDVTLDLEQGIDAPDRLERVVSREMVYELASTCFFLAGVARSLSGDLCRLGFILAHGRQLFHWHVAA